MPVDSRRLPVPEESKTPLAYVDKSQVTLPIVKDGERSDGRHSTQLRPVFLKTGVVNQAKGSAYIEVNNTKLICAVYGPREVTRREDFSMQGQISCTFKYATFSCFTRRQHQADSEEKDHSVVLQQALEPAVMLDKFPKARLDIFVTVIENDGSCLSAAVTCASLALADAHIEMYDLVVGSSLLQCEDDTVVDPSALEEKATKLCTGACGSITVGYMPSLQQVSLLVQSGSMEAQTAIQGVKTCIESCEKVYPVVQKCLVSSIQNTVVAPDR